MPGSPGLTAPILIWYKGNTARKAEPGSGGRAGCVECVTAKKRGQRPVGRWPFLFSTAKEGIMPDREVLIQRLTEGSEEFRRLRADHQGFERELSDLQARPFLTTEQQWRVSEVKKL